jgi:uncharacterized protein (TIGR00251 family)
MLSLQQSGTNVLLPVAVQPRASRNAVAGLHGTALKLLLTAPPIDDAANAACLSFLADLIGVSRARLSILRGRKARHKLICIADMSVDAVRSRLRSLYPAVDL